MSRSSNFQGRNPYPYTSVPIANFITNSATFRNNPKYPLNYPYNIYSHAAWGNRPYQAVYNEEESCCPWRKLCWWQPNSDNLAAEFFDSSSMHGLRYVSEPKRNLMERIFWLCAFIACVVVASLMITEVWKRYYDDPVIVSFNPEEVDVDAIPFPAITVCNTNPFSMARIAEFEEIYETSKNEEERMAALDALRVMHAICYTQQSFLKELDYAHHRGKMRIPEAMEQPSQASQQTLTQFLFNNTQPCRELLRICVWEQEPVNCGEFFKPTITDYGKCCTFNMLPQPLMEIGVGPIPIVSTTGKPVWTKEEIDDWKQWNFNDDGYVVQPKLNFPRRQRRAGTSNGLSLLLHPDIENSFCPSTDTDGIKILYHTPLDVPRVADLGLVVDINREVFLEISADLTMADDAISTYAPKSRRCYFGAEYKLNKYKPYTRTNCLEECWNEIITNNCSCVFYYSPHDPSIDVCSTKPGSVNDECITEHELLYLKQLPKICSHCMYSCNNLEYNAQVTYAKLQHPERLWKGNESDAPWSSQQISTVHIYMGKDSTVPKLRAKLYQTVDLIANTGGLLGLYIGFSVLSAVEIVYFATMRICCKIVRKSKQFGNHQA